ncbi:hypothetical protein [Blastococcus mobilis]|uniref:Uncharacterized protein n=1 Tax=Blastococcus mobilis TaxID=1938746 RepID=A0A239AKG2_9ACTN|nr:hypothetical protein [Blastococcus mobilis]SNR96156.1 hypothetical protein SAMN06272737_1485 [Blastococcus mobilis]
MTTMTTARGAAAGAVGVLAMDVVTWLMYRREDPADLAREQRARAFGQDTAHALVRRVAEAVGSDAGGEQPNGAGIAVHYALGMGPGAATPRSEESTHGYAPGAVPSTASASLLSTTRSPLRCWGSPVRRVRIPGRRTCVAWSVTWCWAW